MSVSATAQRFIWGAVSIAVLVGCVVAVRAMRPPSDDRTTPHEPMTIPRADEVLTPKKVDPPKKAPHTVTPMVVRWAETWRAAQKLAATRDQLVMLYVGLAPETCPPCRYLESSFFTDPTLEALNSKCVPHYIRKYDERGKVHPEDRELLDRLNPVALPMLIFLAPDGGVILRQSAGLYAAYGLDRKVGAEAPEGLLTPASLLKMVEEQTQRGRAAAERMKDLRLATGAKAAHELAQLLADREQYAAAIGVAQASLDETPSVETRALVAAVQLRAGNHDAAEQVYHALIRDEPDHPSRLAWRLELVRLRLDRAHEDSEGGPAAEGLLEAQLIEIAETAAVRGHAGLEARAHAALAHLDKRQADTAALKEHLAWFAREYLAPESTRPALDPALRLEIAELSLSADQLEIAVAHLERLQIEHPTSAEAQVIKHGMIVPWRRAVQKRRAAAGG